MESLDEERLIRFQQEIAQISREFVEAYPEIGPLPQIFAEMLSEM
jgi:hypothetical protein